MLKLDAVSKTYNRTQVVAPTDLWVEPGRTTVLIGPSGCGKSTLLRLMTGLIEPDGGSICFGSTQLTSENAMMLRRKMGYVLQDGGLFPHLTARQNVTLMARYLRSERPQEIEDRVLELAELTQYPRDALDRYPGQISGGQRQRVGLMRALMLDPDMVLLDEPMGALDPLIRFDLQEDLRRIFKQLGKTVVLVTHDMTEAGFFADKVVLMAEGRIVQQGPFEELLDAPADPFVTRFVNAQRMPKNGNGRKK